MQACTAIQTASAAVMSAVKHWQQAVTGVQDILTTVTEKLTRINTTAYVRTAAIHLTAQHIQLKQTDSTAMQTDTMLYVKSANTQSATAKLT